MANTFTSHSPAPGTKYRVFRAFHLAFRRNWELDERSFQAEPVPTNTIRHRRIAPMFRQITETVFASPQIGTDAIAEAKALGIVRIINNRPEGESEDQVAGDVIAAEAAAAGIDYVAIPVGHGGFSQAQVDAMADALDNAEGPVLAYCRSGTRSTLLWALARAKAGDSPAVIASKAAAAGYDVSPIRQLIDMLSAGK